MAKTAVVNPKRRKRRKKNPSTALANPRRRRRRRNYGAAAANPRRRRRGGSRRRSYSRRRRNPMETSSTLGRMRNPFDIEGLLGMALPAGAGVLGVRWALNQAGPFEPDTQGKPPVPGLKHAFAIYLAARFGGQLVGQVFGSPEKGRYAEMAALGFGTDLFIRKRFFSESQWAAQNLYLAGVDDPQDAYYRQGMGAFEQQSSIGDTFTDEQGVTYISDGAGGWAVAGIGQLVQGEDGQIYQIAGPYEAPEDYEPIMRDVSGFGDLETTSTLGSSSFGYR